LLIEVAVVVKELPGVTVLPIMLADAGLSFTMVLLYWITGVLSLPPLVKGDYFLTLTLEFAC
jgi:hypothetical protein